MPKLVFLRALTLKEQRALRAKLKDRSLSMRICQRYRIIDEVRRGRSVAEAAARVGCHFTAAYDWVRRFNESGWTTFDRVSNPKGRPPILRAEQLRKLVNVARSGLPFSAWSVSKLAEYCRRRRILPPVTDEWVRRLLRRQGITARRLRTRRTSDAFDRRKKASGGYTGTVSRGRRSALQ